MDDDALVPQAARVVRDFVNTYEPQVDEEALASADTLRDWFAARSLLPADVVLGPDDLRTAVTVREGLRNVLLDHAGHEPDAAAVDALNDVLAARPVRVAFIGGAQRLTPAGAAGIDVALAELLDAVRRSAEDGTWERLKVCARDTCRWAFYDASRNQARRWCSMAGCGNYVKMRRAYATRTGRQPEPPPGSRRSVTA